MRHSGGQGSADGSRRARGGRRSERPDRGSRSRRAIGDRRDDDSVDSADSGDEEALDGASVDGDGLGDEPLFGAQVAELTERVRPHLRAIGLTLLGAVAVAAAWSFASAQQAVTKRQSWDAYLEAINSPRVDALTEIEKQFPGTPAAAWAKLAGAERLLAEGAELAFIDKEGSRQRLESAAAQYSDILSRRPGDLLAERATLGMAKANETLGRLDEARDGYEALAKDHPSSPLADIAAAHAAALADKRTRDFYSWFVSWKPPVAPPVDPGAAAPTGSGPAVTPGTETGAAGPGVPGAVPAAGPDAPRGE